jgi:hypothetical protein
MVVWNKIRKVGLIWDKRVPWIWPFVIGVNLQQLRDGRWAHGWVPHSSYDYFMYGFLGTFVVACLVLIAVLFYSQVRS